MKRAFLLVAGLVLAASSIDAQAVPDSSTAAKVSMAYRRPVHFRLDPFRHIL